MSALSDLQKKLEQEAQGIMFPFSANANTVSTTQNVYDSATDGIMTMQGQKYVGPDAVIQYGTEEQDYQRQLKQIEAPMLPQFDETQFPKAGEGIMQTPTPAPTPTTTPVEPEAPAIDPCPPGFVYDPIKKVCVPIEQPKSDRDTTVTEPRNLTDTAKSLKGNIDFTTGTTADDEKFRAGQYDYEPSRKDLNPLETGGIIGTVVNGLHNIGQYFNEKDAMNKGILVDTTGDGKPDKIDMTQVTRNYQEEEIGLPAGARAFGATESLKADVQYDTAKKLYEETQLKGTPLTTVEEEKITEDKREPSEPATGLTGTRTGLTETVTPRFEGGFGELMGAKEFGQLNRDIEVLGMNIDALQKNLNVVTDRDEFKYQRRRLDNLERELQEKNKTLEKEKQKRQEITDNYNKLQKQKQEEQLQQIKEGKDTRQTYDKPRTQEQRQRETGQTQKQRESRTATTGKFERAKAGASVSGERLRGGI